MSTGTSTVVYSIASVLDESNPNSVQEEIDRVGLDPLRPFVGTAFVIEIDKNPICAADLMPIVLAILGRGEAVLPERLLFRSPNAKRKQGQHCYLDVDAIEYLYTQGVRLIGVDAPSIDPPGKSGIATLMRVNRMNWLVNIDLSELSTEKLYLLFSAPADPAAEGAVPCRAFVVPLS